MAPPELSPGRHRAIRQNMQEMFARELGVQIMAGLMEGPNDTFGDWIGSFCLTRLQEDPARVAEEQIFGTLRVFAPFSSQGVLTANVPAADTGPLEDMADKILDAIARNPTMLGAWYQRVTSIDIDPQTQGVQASIFAYNSNAGLGFTA